MSNAFCLARLRSGDRQVSETGGKSHQLLVERVSCIGLELALKRGTRQFGIGIVMSIASEPLS